MDSHKDGDDILLEIAEQMEGVNIIQIVELKMCNPEGLDSCSQKGWWVNGHFCCCNHYEITQKDPAKRRFIRE